MAWGPRPSIAGTAGAGLFLAPTLATTSARADAQIANLSICDCPDVIREQ